MIYLDHIKNWKQWSTTKLLCDRSTALGNPFIIGVDGTREEVIEKYRVYLPQAYVTNAEIRATIRGILRMSEKEDITLFCHCKPLPCHIEVIKEFIEKL